MLISMHSDVTYAFLSGRYERIIATGPSIASEIQIFESFRGMIASIDSVIFADGRFEGPDVSREFDRITATIQAQRELAAELRAITSTGDEKKLRQHLDSIAAHKDFAHPAGPVDRRDVRSHEASQLLSLLSRKGILQVAQALQSNDENLGRIRIWKERQ